MADILPVLVGGIIALAGTFIGPYFQRKHERWKADREDAQGLREKAAELFAELDRITLESHQATVAVVKLLGDDNAVPSPLPDLGNVRMLVAVYFPEAKSIVDAYEAKNAELSKRLVAEIGKSAQSNNANAIKAMTALLVHERNQHSHQFVREIRAEISTKVPRLK